MSKSPTKAELAAMLHNLEAKLAERDAQLAALAVPTADESRAAIAHGLEDPCPACDGSGVHSSGGDCFRCKGKGYQDAGDLARNAAYDRVRVKRREVAATEGYASLRAIPTELKLGKRITRIDGLYYVTE